MDDVQYVSIAEQDQKLAEVVRDQWFYADHLSGPVTLRIKDILTDPDKADETILTFEDEERWLRLNRENRLLFDQQFQSIKVAIGKPLTFGPALNWKRKPVIKIMPPGMGPKPPRKKRSTDEVNDK